MKKSYFLTKLLTVAGLISVGSLLACAVGPDFVKPDKPHAAGYMTGQTAESIDPIEKDNETSQHYVFGKDIPAEWWSLYHAEALDTLVREALRANPDLEAAQAALREAHENTASGEGAYYPSVEANFSPSRQKQSNISSSNLNSGSYVYNTFAAGLNVSFVPDVFGGTRRQVEVLEAQENQQRFQLEATFLTLTSNVVIGAIQEASLRAQITATEDIIHTEQDQLDILIHQEELGEAGEKDVLAQESLLAQAELTLPGLQKQLEQQRDLLIALVGRLPDENIEQKFELTDLKIPSELPVTLPSKLVEQRPDIRAAEEQLHAASAEIGVATANMLPQINLTAADGSMATRLSQLFVPGNGFWTLAAGFTQPILEGGTLWHHRDAAKAAYDQAAAQYRSTVITAFQNVADTLHAITADTKAYKIALRAEAAASKSLKISQKELILGEIGPLDILNAEQTWQQARISLVQAEASRYTDTAILFQALGGGWWNRDKKNNIIHEPHKDDAQTSASSK